MGRCWKTFRNYFFYTRKYKSIPDRVENVMGEMTEAAEDYSAMYEAACYRYGIDNVTDKTYDEYPRGGTWKPVEEGMRKFEVDIQDSDVSSDELRDELESHGYEVWMKGDDRYTAGTCPYKYVAIVTEESEPVPYNND